MSRLMHFMMHAPAAWIEVFEQQLQQSDRPHIPLAHPILVVDGTHLIAEVCVREPCSRVWEPPQVHYRVRQMREVQHVGAPHATPRLSWQPVEVGS